MRSRGSGKNYDALIFLSFANIHRDDEYRETKLLEEDVSYIQDELDNVTTIEYLLIEGVRNDPVTLDSPRIKLCAYA